MISKSGASIASILCLPSRTTVKSMRIPEEDACDHQRNLCVFSHVQKETPGLTQKRMRLPVCIRGCAQSHHGRSLDETNYRKSTHTEC